MKDAETPFKTLGKHLQYVREQSRQSLAEVSGAVEIDETQLARIEAGVERPAEDILLLLISHFGVQDREAVQLWELAQYDSDLPEAIRPDMAAHGKPMVMLLAIDVRTLYSDGAEVSITPAGVTMHFTQAGGDQPVSVAKIGMSHAQAEQVKEALEQALLRSRYLGDTKLLPPNV